MNRETLNRRAHAGASATSEAPKKDYLHPTMDPSDPLNQKASSNPASKPSHSHSDSDDSSEGEGFEYFGGSSKASKKSTSQNAKKSSPFLHFLQSQQSLFIITALSFFTRFWSLKYPPEIVFDEVHFGYFAGSYIKGEHYFDIHPPLSKLILAYAGWLGGYDGHFEFYKSYEYDGDWYIPLRMMPAFFGSLHAPATYLTMKEMHASELASFFTGMTVVVEMCMLMESRIIVTDAILMLFVILSFYFHVRTKNKKEFSLSWFFNMCLCGVFIGCCISSKWTALATMAVIGLDVLIGLLNKWNIQSVEDRALSWITRFLLLFALPIGLYIFSWVLHLRYLPKSGMGDDWMSPEFRKNLIGNNEPDYVEPKGLIDSIIELQVKLYINNKSIVDPHNWMTSWWSWPFLLRGLAYWVGGLDEDPPNTRRTLYLLGNPLVWWTTTAILLFFFFYLFRIPHRSNELNENEKRYIKIGVLLVGGYMLNWLPFILIARVTFLYHYMPSLYFSILLVGHTLDTFVTAEPKRRLRIFCLVLFIFISTFIYHSPNVYGWPLTLEERKARRWFSTWT